MAGLVGAFLVGVVLSAGPSVGFGTTGLVAAASASPRPKECVAAAMDSEGGAPAWERVRRPHLAEYCGLLALGYARLEQEPSQALLHARTARRLVADGVADAADARVLEGRAELALRRAVPAWTSLTATLEASPNLLRSPAALHDYAIASGMAGHADTALRAYRQLAARAELFSDPARTLRIYVEAGVVAMQVGPAGLDEALGYLGEGRGDVSLLRDWALGYLALALDRYGRSEQARGVLAELELQGELERWAETEPDGAGDPALWLQLAPQLPAVVRPELHALAALLLEREDRSRALEQWRYHLATSGPSGPWRTHAEGKVLALQRSRP